MSYICNWVGQLVHGNVEKDAVALVLPMVSDKRPWPEGTAITSESASSMGVRHTVRSPGGGLRVWYGGPPPDPEIEDLRVFVTVKEDGGVDAYASDGRPPFEHVPCGHLTKPLAWVAEWDVVDRIHQGNESWARGLWYVDDLIAWHEAELVKLYALRQPR